MSADKLGWTCFHCGEHFGPNDTASARQHFGPDEGSTAACLIKGADHGLLRALRDAEASAGDAWHALHAETTDAHKALYAAHSRHGQALRSAEESGYERGLADGRYEAADEITRLKEEVEEAGQIGERDGYERALQELDQATGGDGEYRYCTDHDPERHCPDADTMKARVVARFAAKQALIDELVEGLVEAKREMWTSARHQWTLGDFKNWAAVQQIDALISKARSSGKAGLDA